MSESLTFCGRSFDRNELELMCQMAVEFSALGVTEIARTVCELLDWKRPNGRLKNHECRQLLERLAAQGRLRLPDLRQRGGKGPRRPDVSEACFQPAPMEGRAGGCEPLELMLVQGRAESRSWRQQLEQHHYLGCPIPFGANLRYWVRHRDQELACLLWTSPAWKMRARDAWIGWSNEQRRHNLQSVVNNGRFLILPWVRIKGLASKILALSARQLPLDWETRYGCDVTHCCWKPWWMRPVFAEPATGLLTGSISGRPPGAGAWIGSTKVTAKRSRTFMSIPWSAMSASGYAEISRSKQIQLLLMR